jgi:hypothetical protein
MRNEQAIYGDGVEYLEHTEMSDDVLILRYRSSAKPVGRGNHGMIRYAIDTRLAIYVRGQPAGRVNVSTQFEDRDGIRVEEVETRDG